MQDRFAVIGMGQFGFRVAKQLTSKGAEVLAIDKDFDLVEMIKDEVTYAVSLDSTDIKALGSQNLQDMDAVLVAIGENIEGLLLTTVLLLELNVKRIVARAMSDQQRIILEKLGVKEILSPEDEVGLMVPDVRGLTLKDALYVLENQGLKVRPRGNGRVLKQSLKPGSRARKGRVIYISLG